MRLRDIGRIVTKWRRQRADTPSIRSIGAEVFAEHAAELRADTEDLLKAIMAGKLAAEPGSSVFDFPSMVRRHRESLARKVDDDLLMQEIVERVQRAALLHELQRRFPELTAFAVAQVTRANSDDAARGAAVNEKDEEVKT